MVHPKEDRNLKRIAASRTGNAGMLLTKARDAITCEKPKRLELFEGKLSRTVLRGGGDGNTAFLLGTEARHEDFGRLSNIQTTSLHEVVYEL